MSALPPKADIGTQPRNVCFVPKTDISNSFDHIVGATEQQRWHVEVQRLGGLEIDDQFKLCRRLDREVGRLLALEDAVDVLWHLAKLFDIIRTVGHQAA